jgi:hypothetical protein
VQRDNLCSGTSMNVASPLMTTLYSSLSITQLGLAWPVALPADSAVWLRSMAFLAFLTSAHSYSQHIMDLSHLTRPGILSQCSRCSSSLAALENEWAKLTNVYAIPTAWLSVDLHRISVLSERKLIPHSSEMTLLRGRIIQEVSCKLCQQRIGVLCPFDNG